jgi:hypothetical protein
VVVPSELNDALKGLGSVVGKAVGSEIPAVTPGRVHSAGKDRVQKEIEKQSDEEERACGVPSRRPSRRPRHSSVA